MHAGVFFLSRVNVFVPARVRAGKGAVYEIIYVDSAVAAGGAAQLETCRKHWKNINQPAVCTKVENIINVSFFEAVNKWAIYITHLSATPGSFF